jgi:hypothetical protein
MTSMYEVPRWVDFDLADPLSKPADGRKVLAALASGRTGPATFHDRTGFILFGAPWGYLGPVLRWK